MGSVSLSSVRLGSALEITAFALISSPVESSTPVAAPSFTRISMTSAPVRISAPAAFAAEAMACGECAHAAGGEERRARGMRIAGRADQQLQALPADHGPRKVPKIPRAAITARNSSVSKYSATRSATAIGPQRRTRYISRLPRLRRARPVLSMLQRSPPLGWSMSGGVVASASAITLLIFPRDFSNSGYLAASFCEKAAIDLRGFVFVLIERKRATVGRERGDASLRRDQPQAVFFQLHVADDVWANRAGGVRQRGAAEAGMKFIGDGGAADLGAALEDERFESGFGEIERGDQPVVAAADDDDVAPVDSSRAWLRGSLDVFQNFQRGEASGRAHDAAAGMRGRAAHVEILEWACGSARSPARDAGRRVAPAKVRPGRCCLRSSPHSRSRSSGVMTCWCRMMSLMLGAYSAMVLTTVSPKASF